MRIPIGEEEVGVWYPIGDDYYFISKEATHYKNNLEGRNSIYGKRGLRESTFHEFKEEFPYTVYSNGSKSQYRTKKKKKK